jgi:phosphoserine phosphatase
MQASELSSWNDTPTRQAIIDFVDEVTSEGGSNYVPPEERIAVFDNDGTLWTEKPMPIEVGFILQRMASMAEQDPSLREKQPFKASYEKDYAWLGGAITKHYQGDESDLKAFMAGLLQAFRGMAVEDYTAAAHTFLHQGKHPTLGRIFADCGFVPMVELLRYLESNGFVTFIASGGDRDFMRPITWSAYGIPPERVIGSSSALRYTPDNEGGTLAYQAEMEFFDDDAVKPVRIWSRIGRRPIFAAGNSNGDIPMLQWAGGPGRLGFRLLVLHDDKEREFDYVGGAEKSLDLAKERGWTVVSVKNDWSKVFAD